MSRVVLKNYLRLLNRNGPSSVYRVLGLCLILSITACTSQVSLPNELPEASNGLTPGGELRLSVAKMPDHLDPHQTTSVNTLTWGPGLVYSRLFKFATDSNSGDRQSSFSLTNDVVCDLCTSWRRIGNLKFEISLREDITWHDTPPVNGRTLTAEDVVQSYRRQATPGWANAALLENVAEFNVIDMFTLEIVLTEPDPDIFYKLAHGGSSIVPPELYSHNPDILLENLAIGSGPWVLNEFSDISLFTANPNYYGFDSSGNRLPYFDTLRIQFLNDAATRFAGVGLGFFDASNVNPDVVDSTDDEVYAIGVRDMGNGVEVVFNTANTPLDDPAIRRAFLLLWDLESWGQNLWGYATQVSAGLGPIEFDQSAVEEYALADESAANQLLNQAGLSQTEPIIVSVGNYGDEYLALAQMMVESLNSFGLLSQLEVLTTRDYAENIWISNDYMIAVGPSLPVYTPADKLLGVYHSEGGFNTTGYANEELDSLIEDYAVEYDLAERNTLSQAIAGNVLDAVFRLNISDAVAYWAISECIRDFVPNNSGGDSSFLTQAWFDQSVCAR